jgi:Tfp pilus assembly protein PilF
MDLRLLLAVEAAAEHCLRQALDQLTTGEEAAAMHNLRRALGLRHDPLVAHLLELLAAEARDREAVARPHGTRPPADWYLT